MLRTDYSSKLGRRQNFVIALLLAILLMLVGCTDPFSASPTPTTGPNSGQSTAPAQQVTGNATSSSASAVPTGTPGTSSADQGSASSQSQAFPEQQAIIDVVNRTRPAVVAVVNQVDRSQTGFAGEALGTGMIVDTQVISTPTIMSSRERSRAG